MQVTSRNIKCPECGVFTQDADFCKNCGTLISHQKKMELKEEVLTQKRIEEERWKIKNPTWIERLKKHPFFLYRGFGYVLYSVVFTVSAIGSVIAWVIAMIAAG